MRFIEQDRPESPCIILHLDTIRCQYETLQCALPSYPIYYAIKANPFPEILRLLVKLGSCFDTASLAEIEMALAAGARPEQISFGNTIKKETDIASAYALGVRLFAVDALEEVDKIVRAAPGSEVFCRILTHGTGAQWPLSRKFGCVPEMAIEILRHAHKQGLKAAGVSFHVGSQQTHIHAWDEAIRDSAMVFERLAEENIPLYLLNLGGGFPGQYTEEIPSLSAYGAAIEKSLQKHFKEKQPKIIIEPGRGLVADAGVLYTEVVLISKKSAQDSLHWVYIDAGKFNGLIETSDESIRYKIIAQNNVQNHIQDRVQNRRDETMPCVLAGPTCDSVDILYEKNPYPLPASLKIGDKLLILGTGAYTATYASIAFNGFAPLKTYII